MSLTNRTILLHNLPKIGDCVIDINNTVYIFMCNVIRNYSIAVCIYEICYQIYTLIVYDDLI